MVGRSAGYNNTTGRYNVMIGYEAGFSNGSNYDNVYIGNLAGRNCSGSSNVMIGNEAGEQLVTGQMNVFIGDQVARAAGLDADENTIIGYQAGTLTTGDFNVFVGRSAGLLNSGNRNVCVGNNTLANGASGQSNNTCIGHTAGEASSVGSGNTLLGYSAGYSLSGSDNLFLGYNAGGNAEGSKNVFIGYYVGWNAITSNKLYIDYENTTTPLIWGDFAVNTLRFNAVVGVGRAPSTSYGLYVDGGASYEMRVVGDAHASGAFYSDSDVRLKKNIQTYENAMEKLMQIRGVSFEWRKDEFPEIDYDDGTQVGVIAQEIEMVFPEFVSSDDEFKAVDYAKFSAVFIEAFKEQQEIIEKQQKEIDELKEMMKEILKK